MSIPLQNARLCMDCDTIFEEPRCPNCSSESYFPVSRWVRPAVAQEKVTVRKTAKKASMVLLGTGAAFALWKLLGKAGHETRDEGESTPQSDTVTEFKEPRRSRVRKRASGPDVEG